MKLANSLKLGRSEDCELQLDDDTVSRVHAQLRLEAGARLLLTDLESSNGSFVHREGRWQPLKEAEVFPEDRLKFGERETTVRELLAPFPAFAVLLDGIPPGQADLALTDEARSPAYERPRRNPRTGDIEDLD